MTRSAPPLTRPLGLAGVLLTGALLAGAVPAKGDVIVSLSDQEVRRLGIETGAARQAEALTLPDQPGVVRVPNENVHVLTAPAQGVLTRLWVAEGERVQAGDRLAELAGPGVAALETAYRDALGEHALATQERARTAGLVQDGVLPAKARQQAEVDVARATGALARARAALAVAGVSDARLRALDAGALPAATLTLNAREAGTVLRQFVLPGERLEIGAPLLQLGRLDRLWVEVHVPLDQVRGFEPGDAARVHGAPGETAAGRILTLGRRVHEADRGLLVRVLVDDPGDRLIPGQAVRVSFSRPAPADAVEVPASALVTSATNESAVFVQRGEGWEQVAVEVIAGRGTTLVVRGKVRSGDEVAVSGTSNLQTLAEQAGEAL